MQFTTEDEPDLTLPEDSIHRARLMELKLRTRDWVDATSGEKKEIKSLEWWWEITSTALGPQYIGRRVKGECNPKITNRPGNRFREWAQAILNRDIPTGMVLDTDDLVGLEAEIVIGHQPNKKDPSRPWENVTDVAPVSDGFGNEPPF